MSAVQKKGVAIISGGSSGIGLACACELAARGYRLVLIARDVQRLEAARDMALKHGAPEALTLSLDVVDEIACAKAVDQLIQDGETIDWLITCAGDVEPGLFETQGIDAHRRQFDLNYFGTLNLVAPVAHQMVAQGSGRIVLVSSAAAFVGIAGYSAYGATKFAIRGLGEALRIELAPHGVTCSVAFPPDTHTPQLAREAGVRPEITALVASSGGAMSPEMVARKMIAQALKGRFILAPSLLISLFSWTHSLCAPFFLARQTQLIRKIAARGGKQLPGKHTSGVLKTLAGMRSRFIVLITQAPSIDGDKVQKSHQKTQCEETDRHVTPGEFDTSDHPIRRAKTQDEEVHQNQERAYLRRPEVKEGHTKGVIQGHAGERKYR